MDWTAGLGPFNGLFVGGICKVQWVAWGGGGAGRTERGRVCVCVCVRACVRVCVLVCVCVCVCVCLCV